MALFRELRKLVREGVTYVPQDYPLDVKLSDTVRLRMEELQEVKEWYAVVRRGSQVFSDPKAFPPDFCRAARALDRALKGRIGRGGVGHAVARSVEKGGGCKTRHVHIHMMIPYQIHVYNSK